ncbi:hypothetical protein CDL12_07323 [Handroanthus impetiginosus]|uniref:C2 domain-containing protein n=1 Tax=Handroanthus impetiginosus TaxID=429701 RepID=A0A2G9HR52_9LAMI|nr:hypothetical protein CDL12_07323 [Handroanthus impetiginosus]
MQRPSQEEFLLKEVNADLHVWKFTGDKLKNTDDLVKQIQCLYLGNYNHTNHHVEKNSNPKWNQVFTFSKDRIQGSILEVIVKDKGVANDDFIGPVVFDLGEIPNMVVQDGPLAPQRHRLEDKKNRKTKGKLLLAVWMGAETEADELSHLDAAESNSVSSVYLSPKLWYLRVNVIDAKNLQLSDQSRSPDVFVKAILGNQALRTRVSMSRSINPMWNKDLMFVAAEPFEKPLILSVVNRMSPNKDEVLGRCLIPLQYVDRRLDHKPVNTRCSDLRPTAKQLWKSSTGVLELGILNARGLPLMKSKDGWETTNAYCVAKYGQKWVRTRTIIDSFAPVWNECCTWEVFDPCTIVTIGVFDNFCLRGGDKSRDSRIVKLDNLRHQATQITSVRLSCAEPPLRKEKMFDEIRSWTNPIATVIIHILFLVLVMYRQLILPSIFLCLFLIIVWYHRWRPRYPLHINARLSCADDVHPEELDEEFDTSQLHVLLLPAPLKTQLLESRKVDTVSKPVLQARRRNKEEFQLRELSFNRFPLFAKKGII